ncbi:AUGMIN subunit 3 [Vigna angularis]|nr:AUGMIN subunit 3 [Vigna angularis]
MMVTDEMKFESCSLARHQFLKIACQLEKKHMLGAFSLLKVIESELQAYLSVTEGRVGHCLALIQGASDVQEQGGVHDSDNFLHAIRDLLKIYSRLSNFVTASYLEGSSKIYLFDNTSQKLKI